MPVSQHAHPGRQAIRDALVDGVGLAVDAVGVDLEQDGDAVTGAAGDFDGGDPGVDSRPSRPPPSHPALCHPTPRILTTHLATGRRHTHAAGAACLAEVDDTRYWEGQLCPDHLHDQAFCAPHRPTGQGSVYFPGIRQTSARGVPSPMSAPERPGPGLNPRGRGLSCLSAA